MVEILQDSRARDSVGGGTVEFLRLWRCCDIGGPVIVNFVPVEVLQIWSC